MYLAANYIGDLIKKETGLSALNHIQRNTMYTAKDRLVQTNKSISEISYCLGYMYPQYFTRAFKNAVGLTPNEYRRAE